MFNIEQFGEQYLVKHGQYCDICVILKGVANMKTT